MTDLSYAGRELDALLDGYGVPDGHFDELRGATPQEPRAHWAAFGEHARDLRPAELSRAEARVARQIHENGVTYNVYAAAEGPTRPWALDVLPHIIPAAEWQTLAAALRQRARLLEAVTADIYGDQRLLADGLLPPALVLGHPGFLRACHGVRPPSGTFLHVVAFDLARGPDGGWRVIDTRSQAPSGAGYALENRITVSRLFPDAFRELHVDRLAPFFRTLQETLLAAAPQAGAAALDGSGPHIVLLTPGPFNETYFEHAYLARYLGFTLAEGGDLTVRDDRVYLKTVSGLRAVHAILRRLDDAFCDALELRADSTLGVPGLVQAWRAGHVLVANAFGSGVLESPALKACLPAVCARLFDEPLLLPSSATWWCGDPTALGAALPRLSEMVIKPAFPDSRMERIVAGGLDDAARAAWRARLQATPDPFVLEEYLPLSYAPVWHEGRLESRALMLRAFLVSDGRGDYRVMPGGLSRIAGDRGQTVSGQRGGSSKDTWVLSDAPVERVSLLTTRARVGDIAGSERLISSRAGEHLFWLGRYAERSENSARLLRAALSRLHNSDGLLARGAGPVLRTCHRNGLLRAPRRAMTEAPGAGVNENASAGRLSLAWDEPGAATLGPRTWLVESEASADRANPTSGGLPGTVGASAHDLELALIQGLFDAETYQSLAFNVAQTVRVGGAVRDRLSSDNWRVLHHLARTFVHASGSAPRPTLAEALELIDEAILSLVAVGGLEMAHMTRDDGWRLLSLGRHLERLLYIATTVRAVAQAETPEEPALLDWLLDLSDSSITYRARYMRQPEWLAVVELLLFDPRNPRSAAFQLAKLAKHVRLLPESNLTELVARIERDGAAHLIDPSQGELFLRADALSGFLQSCEDLAVGLSDALTLRYFSHVYETPHATALL